MLVSQPGSSRRGTQMHTVIRWVFVVLAVSGLVTIDPAQTSAPSSPASAQPCVTVERLVPCKTDGGQGGFLKEVCTRGTWSASQNCVPFVKPGDVGQKNFKIACVPSFPRYKSGPRSCLQQQTCMAGRWVDVGPCIPSYQRVECSGGVCTDTPK